MKAPDYGKSAIAATTLLPEAKGLIITRDPIPALDSHKRGRDLSGQRHQNWPRLLASIRAFQDLANRIETADPSRVHWVRYEDLIAGPEAKMREVARWLCVDYHPSLVEPTMLGKYWPGVSSFQPTDGIDATPLMRPIKALTAHELEFAMWNLKGVRATWGYTAEFELSQDQS